MKRFRLSRARLAGAACALAALAGGLWFAGADDAQTRYVKRDKARVFEKPDSLSKETARLARGETVQELERKSDYARVRTGDGREGYIFAAYLSETAPEKPRTGKSIFEIQGGETASGVAGTKGVGPVAQDFAHARAISPITVHQVDWLQAIQVKPEEQDAFEKEGNLGDYRKAQ